jgi:hypothetical protein
LVPDFYFLVFKFNFFAGVYYSHSWRARIVKLTGVESPEKTKQKCGSNQKTNADEQENNVHTLEYLKIVRQIM